MQSNPQVTRLNRNEITRFPDYKIRVFAQQAGQAEPLLLSQIKLTLDLGHAAALAKRAGVLFKLEPDTQTYAGHADERPSGMGRQDRSS